MPQEFSEEVPSILQSQISDPTKKVNQGFDCNLRPDAVQDGEVLRVRIKNTSQLSQKYSVVGRSRHVKFEPKPNLEVALKPNQSTNLTFQPTPKSRPLIGGEFSHPFRVQIQSSEGEIQILRGEVSNSGRIPYYLAIFLFFIFLSGFYFFTRPSPAAAEIVKKVATETPVFTQTPLVPTPTKVVPSATPNPALPHAGDILYLSFDDGPSTQWTPKILDILKKHDVKATFFIVGQNAKEHPEVVHAVVDAGHIIAHHTWSHSSLAGLSFDAFAEEVYLSNAASVRELAPCIRLPYAEADANTESYAAELGLDIIWWDVDPFDWSSPGQEYIESVVLDEVSPDDIILLHDGGGDRSQTLAALDTILTKLKEQGYRFELLCVD